MTHSSSPHDAASGQAHTNLLVNETSPYLLQHAHNPVDWHPWGPAALELARSTGKPILLSIGYSACHWCHVMAHESFEDVATATLMNELFVNIKVDREERPDIDKIYQLAHQILTQRGGGWPLTMFLAHDDHRPFFGGTYFPDRPRHGMPAFSEILQRVAEYYSKHSVEIREHSNSLMQVFDDLLPPTTNPTDFDDSPLSQASERLATSFDKQFGGFGSAPKFPHPTTLEFLLRQWRSSVHDEEPNLQSLYLATLTLTRMAEGGIYDQLGGGFCRYSVDQYWMIPHFEKMLYDNGPLLALYAQAAIATGDSLYKRIAAETAAWLMRDMQAPQGGYWSTLDADSEGHEGKFYVWQPEQVRELLSPQEYAAFAKRFGLDGADNFEGAWHLHVYCSFDEVAQSCNVTAVEAEKLVDAARSKLLPIRNQRVWPGRDEKILTSWNGLAIKGMAIAARALAADELAISATRAVDFIHNNLWRDGRLLAVHKDGQSKLPAYLDDYAFLLDALLELLQTRWRAVDLKFATQLADAMLNHFEDQAAGGFYFTADDAETLIHRPKSFGDEAVPAGNGIAAYALNRLGHLLGEPRYLDATERTLRAAWPAIQKYPQGHTSLLIALEEHLSPVQIVIIRGSETQVTEWQRQLAKMYSPKRIVLGIPNNAEQLPPALASKLPANDTVGYVCHGTHCSEPLKSLASLIALSRD